MFEYPGNIRLLCITDDISISVNLPLPSVLKPSQLRFTYVLAMSVIHFDLLSDDENKLKQNFPWEQE